MHCFTGLIWNCNSCAVFYLLQMMPDLANNDRVFSGLILKLTEIVLSLHRYSHKHVKRWIDRHRKPNKNQTELDIRSLSCPQIRHQILAIFNEKADKW